MAVSPATLSLNRVAEKARQLFSPVVNTYNQVNTAYQRVNNPPVRQMYNQLPQRLEPLRRTYNQPIQQINRVAQIPFRVNPLTAPQFAISNRYKPQILSGIRTMGQAIARSPFEVGLTVNEVAGGRRTSPTPRSILTQGLPARYRAGAGQIIDRVLGTSPFKSYPHQAETGGMQTLVDYGMRPEQAQKYVPAMALAGFALDATPPGVDDLLKTGGKKLIPKVAGKLDDLPAPKLKVKPPTLGNKLSKLTNSDLDIEKLNSKYAGKRLMGNPLYGQKKLLQDIKPPTDPLEALKAEATRGINTTPMPTERFDTKWLGLGKNKVPISNLTDEQVVDYARRFDSATSRFNQAQISLNQKTSIKSDKRFRSQADLLDEQMKKASDDANKVLWELQVPLKDTQYWNDLRSRAREIIAKNPEVIWKKSANQATKVDPLEALKAEAPTTALKVSKSPEQILQEIASSKVGKQGKALNDEELTILGQYLRQQGDHPLRGTVYKPYGGGEDVVFGVIKDRNWKGQTEYLVMNNDARNSGGRFRLHSTPITSDQIISRPAQPTQLTDLYNQATQPPKGKIESIKHPTGLSLGDVEQVNGLLKNKGVVIEGSGTKTATIKVPKQLMESLGINKNGFTLKGDYYEIQRPGALFNIHSDKTTLAQAIQKAESNVAQPTQPLTKGKIEANQTVIGKTQISPQTKLETPQPLPNVANASPGLMTQAPTKKQLVQLKKQQGKLLSNDQEKVQPQAFDDIIAEGRRSIGSAKQEPGRPVKQVLNDLYTQWVDRYHPLSRASKQAKNTLRVKGAELRPEYDPDYLVRRLTGAGGIADQKFNTELKPIIDEVDQLGIPKLDMDTYLAHKRMAGFGDVDREIVGADPIKSKQITTALEAKYPQISGVADKLYKYQDQGLQELVNAGFISPDAVKTIRSQNPDYAPLYRVMDEMDEYLGLPTRKTMQGKNPVVKIKGSKRQIESPVESIIGNTFRQRAAIEKNRVAQSIIGLNKVADMGFNKVAKSGNDTITVWNNGVKEYWQVGTDIADVAKGVNEEVTNTLLKIIQAPAQLLRQGATGRNPAFMIPNVIRDQLDAGITSKYGYIPFVDYVSGLKSMVKNDAIYQKWQNSGAKIDLGELSGKKSVAKLFDEKKSKKRLYQWITAGLDVMGKYSEQPTRVGLFKKAYSKTGNELLGAMESRDATVDFARMGSKMKVANSIIPFLNVGVQGFDKLVRATRNNPKKVLLNMGIYGATPAIAVTAYNLQNFPEEYEEIPQYLKDDNFVIVVGRNAEGVVDYLTIPKGNILPIVTNPIQSFMEYMAGVDSKSFSELATSLVSDTLPVLEGGNTPTEVLVKTTGSMIPQFAKPIIEDITNKSFYKYDAKKEAQGKESGAIVPYYLKSKPPYQQTYDFTPQMYQKIGAVLNVSPLRVKNLMEGYLAGYAKIPSQVVEMMTAISKGESINPNDKTVLSRFIGQTYPTSGGNKPVEKEKSPGLMERATGKVSADDGTSAIPTDQETFNELYKKALSNGTDFPTQKALIEADPTLDEAKKAEKIEKLRTETAQWAETLVTMQDKYPGQVFKAELKTYSGNTYKVPERAEWVAKQLNKATTPEEMRDMLDQMWNAGVLTTGKTGTAKALIDMGINVYAIGNKVGTKSKKAKSSGTKVKKPKKISFTSIKVPKVKLTKVKTFKPPKAKKLRIKKMRKYKIRSMA